MKRSSRSPPRSTKRVTDDGLVEQPANPLKYASAFSENRVRGAIDGHIPLSLDAGAGRRHWDEVLRLLVTIRTECDDAAERLGYASNKDDGLAAVEYIANKILEAARSERQQQIVNARKEPPTEAHENSKPSPANYETRYKTDKPPRRVNAHSERTQRIDELKEMLRNSRTKSGVFIDPQLAHEIAKQITVLNEGLAHPETPESIKQMRTSIAPFVADHYGSRQPTSKALGRTGTEKVKQAKRVPSRAKKTAARNAKRRSR